MVREMMQERTPKEGSPRQRGSQSSQIHRAGKQNAWGEGALGEEEMGNHCFKGRVSALQGEKVKVDGCTTG